MKDLKIKLNQKFRSFETDFNATLHGDLIILSGVNGSGKSQLLNIIYGQEGRDNYKKINSTILIDEQLISLTDIDIRSFKDNTNIPELTPSTSQSFINSSNSAWEIYYRDRLDPLSQNNYQYADSCTLARKILQEGCGVERFDSVQITENEFKSKLRQENFIWRTGDKFTNSIGEIFFNHSLKVSEMMKDVGRANYNSTMIEKAPWTVLNELFEKLNLEYRFKNDYFIIGVEINEQPRLFPLNIDGSINGNEGRILSDLSDGEKTIISLCFASLIGNKFSDKKLLLLDELDSVLNPSLIEIFFTVIDEFFTKQGIMVVMSTHSPATISLSPNHTKFYEIFKPNQKGIRILEVLKDDYTELLIANKNFYDKISNQQNRITELEKTINSNVDILIVTEGKTDWKYFIAALRYFNNKNRFTQIKEDFFYRFGSQEDLDNSICGTKEVNELCDSKLTNYLSSLRNSREIDNTDSKTRIGIFDSDTKVSLVNDNKRNIFSIKIEPEGISTEFLFKDEEIKTNLNGRRLFVGDEFNSRTKKHKTENYYIGGLANNPNKAGKRTIIETDVYDMNSINIAISKEKFAQEVYNNQIIISEDSWENFAHIFEFISNKIPKEETSEKVE